MSNETDLSEPYDFSTMSREALIDCNNRMYRLLTDVKFREITVREGYAEFGIGTHLAVKLFAESLNDTLGDAPNFVTAVVGPFPGKEGQVRVTLQREGKHTPENKWEEAIRIIKKMVNDEAFTDEEYASFNKYLAEEEEDE